MTRFARAKGSKSSNERAPEDSTPWEIMKDQFLQAKQENDQTKKRQEAEKQRLDNYENFLKEQKVKKRKATWCEFPDASSNTINDSLKNTPSTTKKKKKSKVQKSGHNILVDSSAEPVNKLSIKKKRNKKKKNIGNDLDVQNEQIQISSLNLVEERPNKKKNKKIKPKKMVNNSDILLALNPSEISQETKTDVNIETSNKNNYLQSKHKKKKMIDGKPIRRKEINDHSFQLIINGKDIELVRFDGFPIMKKDAERLQELQTNMIKKGIPKSEVQRTIKLERRRAEKALARLKKDVCYNCRKGGHVLSDCPELKSKIPNMDVADGVCFKCGSTEHRQFECKVQKDKEFRFATCFICKEAGHIARQCPDNPKGLYPNGGCCKLCGDVTHLRKDCPTITDKKEESNVKLQTLDAAANIEEVEHQQKPINQEIKKKPKKIKF